MRNIRTKTRPITTGGVRGGIPFERGALFYLLRNRFYIGEVRYKGEILPGEQPPIIERALFEPGPEPRRPLSDRMGRNFRSLRTHSANRQNCRSVWNRHARYLGRSTTTGHERAVVEHASGFASRNRRCVTEQTQANPQQ